MYFIKMESVVLHTFGSKTSITSIEDFSHTGFLTHRIHSYRPLSTGLEIATDTVANATKTFNLATENSSLVATFATMFL